MINFESCKIIKEKQTICSNGCYTELCFCNTPIILNFGSVFYCKINYFWSRFKVLAPPWTLITGSVLT